MDRASGARVPPRRSAVRGVEVEEVDVHVPHLRGVEAVPHLADQGMVAHLVRQGPEAGIHEALVGPEPPGGETPEGGKAGGGEKLATRRR
jgi:hypothetical protein